MTKGFSHPADTQVQRPAQPFPASHRTSSANAGSTSAFTTPEPFAAPKLASHQALPGLPAKKTKFQQCLQGRPQRYAERDSRGGWGSAQC